MSAFKIDGNNVSFWLQVKPRSTRERLSLGREGGLKLDVHAPATEGQANDACMRFLARTLRMPRSSVEIVSGQRSRRKLIRVTGCAPEEMIARLNGLAAAGKG